MPFRFSLETVLRYRRVVERRRELELQQAIAQLRAVEQQILSLERQARQVGEEGLRALESGVRGAQLHWDAEFRVRLVRQGRELEKEWQHLDLVRAEKQQAFQKAYREREAVEVLRHDQARLHQQHELRQEQRRLDDQFLLRREHLRRQ